MTQYMNTYAKGTIANVEKMQNTVNSLLSAKNGAKPKAPLDQGIKLVTKKLDILKKLNVGCMTMSYNPVMKAIVDTWQRIYASLQAADTVVSCDLGVQNPVSLADSFVSYSDQLFNDDNTGMDPQSCSLGQKLMDSIVADFATMKGGNKFASIMPDQASAFEQQEAILALVQGSGSISDTSNRNWGVSFDPSARAASIKKRDDAPACAPPASSQASAGGSLSAGATATGGSGLGPTGSTSMPLTTTGSSFVSASASNSANSTVPLTTMTSMPDTTSSTTTSTDTPPTTSSEAASTDLPAPTSTTDEPISTTIEPTATPTESCHTRYKVVLDTFDIYGNDWDDAKRDAGGDPGSGNGLHTQISGCAKVSKWTFEPVTPTADAQWTFHAFGQITIWQKACIERAIVSAGAPSGGCSGSG